MALGVRNRRTNVQKSKSERVRVRSAQGAEGILIRDVFDQKWYFRIYTNVTKSEFVNFELRHQNLCVQIAQDEMAAFYQDENGNGWLDYSPEVLGMEPDEEE